jgi:hypothetical protein
MDKEVKELFRQVREILDKYPHRQTEILFYIFGEDTIKEILNKPTYGELEQKVKQLEEDNKRLLERLGKEVKRNIELSNMSRGELIKMITQLETDNKRLTHNEKVYIDKINQLEANRDVVFTKEETENLLKQLQKIDKCDTALTSSLMSKRIHLENEILKKKVNQLETNRDVLKEWLEKEHREDAIVINLTWKNATGKVLNKMQELERGK